MNINALLTSSLLPGQTDSTLTTSTTTTSRTPATTPASRALQASEQRLQTQLQSATTQISSLGKLQSALSNVQGAATSLAGLTATSSDAATRTALDSFVTAFNAGVTAAHTSAMGDTDGQLLQTAAARRASHQLDRAVTGHQDSATALKAIGVRQGTDGKLSVDPDALAAAQVANPARVRSTLATLGTNAGRTVSHAMASSGAVATSLGVLDARAKALQSRYGAVLALEQQSTAATTAANATTSASGLPSWWFGSDGSS